MRERDDDRLLPEQRARVRIDAMLAAFGSVVQDYKAVNLYAAQGVAVRELPTSAGPADYMLFVDRQAVGVIVAKEQGTTVRALQLLVAPLADQLQMASEIEATREARTRTASELQAQRMRIESLRRAILAAAFSGQLVTQDPSREPASVLLERIRAEREAANAGKKTSRARA